MEPFIVNELENQLQWCRIPWDRRSGVGSGCLRPLGKGDGLLVQKNQVPSSSDKVEALATMRAISFALELHLPSIIVEGDSEVIISALRSKEESFTSFGHLISSIKQSLGIFSCISFSHTHRTGNSLTHNLAQYTRHIDALTVWIENVPPQLHHVLITNFGWFNKVSSAWFSKIK